MNAIIKFFKSIISFITGLFGGKQGKEGFFMEAAPAAAPDVEAAEAPSDSPKASGTPKNGKAQKGKTAAQGKKVGKAAAAGAVAAAATITATPKVLDSVDIIRAALASSQQTSAQQRTQAEANVSFAEMNAVPVATTGRRRPGVNMTGFLDMAKTMRTGR